MERSGVIKRKEKVEYKEGISLVYVLCAQLMELSAWQG